jgi:hypothetical protein
MLTGEAYLSDDQNAAAFLINPENKLGLLQTIRLDSKLVWNAIGVGNIVKALKKGG